MMSSPIPPSLSPDRQSNNDLPPSFSLYVFHLSVLKARGIVEKKELKVMYLTTHPDDIKATERGKADSFRRQESSCKTHTYISCKKGILASEQTVRRITKANAPSCFKAAPQDPSQVSIFTYNSFTTADCSKSFLPYIQKCCFLNRFLNT